ncbi:MAG TPA: hypothetical protein EYP62_00150 [Kiritimatiellae bacterium]|nr:hypothetical protein [Kiritimatiellia bacterium]
MFLGRIRGDIHSTIRHPFYAQKKLLLVERLDPRGEGTGDFTIAVDVVDAGAGETVLVLDEGNSARQVFDARRAPVRSVVIAIVDHVDRES